MRNGSTLWGIHGGHGGAADRLFLQGDCVAIGWSKVGDLGNVPPDREEYKRLVQVAYPDKKVGAIPGTAGQLFRFINEVQHGDLVAYPSKIDRQIHIGRIVGDYRYDAGIDPEYPHQRSVDWLESRSRTRFSQGALYEIGSALTFFQIKNYADEYLAVIESSEAPGIGDQTEDESVGILAEEIEDSARDFVLKRLARELKGHPLAHFLGHLLEQVGYHTRVSPEGRDGGVDIVAHRDVLGFEPPIVKVQVKSGEGSSGDPEVSALYGKLSDGEFGLFVSLGTFTAPARAFAQTRSNLRLIDGGELVDLIFEHYESLDAKYKGLIPLKRVFVPQAIEEDV